MKLLIVITSYRAKELTVDCLVSLEDEVKTTPGISVGICDNGNEDDTFDYLNAAIAEHGWQDWVYTRRVTPNRGFPGGNNVILEEALASGEDYDYYMLLNADTIVRPGAIQQLIDAIESEEGIGIACPRLEWPDGEPQISCFNYISPVSEFIDAARTGPITKLLNRWHVPLPVSDAPMEMEWGSFAAALIRKEVLEEVGVLDEGYFLYFDDVDYGRMARNKGWRIKYFPEPRIVHLIGRSNPVEELTALRKRKPAYWYEARAHYFKKFYGGRIGLFLANMGWYAGRSISFLRERLGSKEPHVGEKAWRDNWIGFWK